MADLSSVSRLAARLPAVEEGTSYGTPAWRVRGKFFARMREDGETLVVKVAPEEKPLLMASEPKVFYETDHYRGHALVLVRLPAIEEGRAGRGDRGRLAARRAEAAAARARRGAWRPRAGLVTRCPPRCPRPPRSRRPG